MNEATQFNQRIASEGMSRITKLLASEEFRWFMRESVITRMEELDRDMKNKTKTPEERAESLERWLELDTLRKWPHAHMNSCGRTLGHQSYPENDFTE